MWLMYSIVPPSHTNFFRLFLSPSTCTLHDNNNVFRCSGGTGENVGRIAPNCCGGAATCAGLVAKIADQLVVGDMAELLSPRQLGYGVRGGAEAAEEAAVHATRKCLHNLPSEHALLKLDFKNALNSIRRDKVLEAVRDLAPDIYPLVHASYSTTSSLRWGDKIIRLGLSLNPAKSICHDYTVRGTDALERARLLAARVKIKLDQPMNRNIYLPWFTWEYHQVFINSFFLHEHINCL